MNRLVGITYDRRCLEHRISLPTKEGPERLQGLYDQLDSFAHSSSLKRYEPSPISDDILSMVHSSFYLEQIERLTLQDNPYAYDKDTYLMTRSLEVAKLASGGCIKLADAIMADEVGRGFALVRPPGHHAESGRGMGFCILNSVAMVAKYLVERYGLARILILDVDIHHGNGTQEIFYESERVLFISLHQQSLFPFTGATTELGVRGGEGYTINLPIQRLWGDLEYSHLFGRVVQNAMEHFIPQFILVSCGFDGHREESISGTTLSVGAYVQMTSALKFFADTYCDGRLLYILEGGYNPNTLARATMSTLDELLSPNVRKPSFCHAARAALMVQNELPDLIKEKWAIDG